jgi:predicted dehydrogenase
MKVLIIGLGSIAKKHITSLLELIPDVEIYALRSADNSAIVSNVLNIYDLKDSPNDVDFIIISNPTSLHASAIEQILIFNTPLFIEKPMFDKIDNNISLVNLIQEKRLKTYIACNLRFHPVINFLKHYIQNSNKRINEVNVYCGSYLPEWRGGTTYIDSYSAKSSMGGGVHLDLIHELDYCIWLFGFPIKHSSVKRKVSQLQIDSIDYCSYNLFYENFNLSVVLNYFRVKPKRQIEIVFEDDVFTCDLLSAIIKNSHGQVIFEEKGFNMNDTYLKQMEYFIDHLNNDKPFMNNSNEAFDILKIALHE